MAYTISSDCDKCGTCLPQCPKGAIQIEEEEYWIEPGLCNNCEDNPDGPQCVTQCPISLPVPLDPKKGRAKVDTRIATNFNLFANGLNNPFASSMVIWEGCNLLAQRESLPWQKDSNGRLYYEQQVKQGRGSMAFRLTQNLDSDPPHTTEYETDISALENFNIRAACLHLIYAAYATSLDKPWEEEFVIDDRQIEKYLGLDKRKDLSKAVKLTLIKELAQQPCKITATINWPQQGKVKGFTVEESRLWQMVKIKHHFQTDTLGYKHLVGLTFRVRPGLWSQYFLNKEGYKENTAFYQYGSFPKFLLNTVTTIWQQHEGATRLMFWLLFKLKMGPKQSVTVPTLMRVAYGQEKINLASSHRDTRKRLLRTFESDLEVLNHYGIKPVFDPVTYGLEIQPLWAKLADLPDDADAALDFWINDGGNDQRLTDAGPRGKWNLLMKARISYFELPEYWQEQLNSFENKRQQKRTKKKKSTQKIKLEISREEIALARKERGISQRSLAEMTGKSQSWVRDLEKGRLSPKPEDQARLRQVLDLGNG